MAELQEKREYYPDRSLRSIYFVDRQGRKQKESKTYKKGSNELDYTELYRDNIKIKRIYSDGKIEKYDERGNITYKYESKEYCGIDMEYKNGKEWTGTRREGKKEYYPCWNSKYFEYSLREGKYDGYYIKKIENNSLYGRHNYESAHFDNGTLNGPYCATSYFEHFDFKKSGIPQLKSFAHKWSEKPDGYSQVSISGDFLNGVFSGKVTKNIVYSPWTNHYHNDVYIIKNGVVVEENLESSHTKIKYDNGRVVYKKTPEIEISMPLDGKCFVKKKDCLLAEWEQKNGVIDGIYKEYDVNGWLKEETKYIAGKKQNTQLYNSDGTVHSNSHEGKRNMYDAYYKHFTIDTIDTSTKTDSTESSKATAVIAGIAGLVVATVSVATFMNSSYQNREKAPEDKKVAPQEVKTSQSKLNMDEKNMFTLAFLASTTEFESFMKKHKDININAANENGETVLMLMLANDKLKNAEYILEKFGDKIEYKARTNDGIGYQDIMKARLHSSKAGSQDIRIDRMIKENTRKEEKQIKEGKTRSADSYVFYDLMKEKNEQQK